MILQAACPYFHNSKILRGGQFYIVIAEKVFSTRITMNH